MIEAVESQARRISARTGPLQRLTAASFATAEEVLKTAALLVVPDDQTQRQAFEKLLPHLYVLRNKGCSWAQLTKLLAECGFKLQPSTVRSYFSEMLADRMDICQARMNEQIAIMAAVRHETANVDLSAIAGRVQAHMQRLQRAVAPTVEALFGPATADQSIAAPPAPRASGIPSGVPPTLPASAKGVSGPVVERAVEGRAPQRPARGQSVPFNLNDDASSEPSFAGPHGRVPATPEHLGQPHGHPVRDEAAGEVGQVPTAGKKIVSKLQDGHIPLKRRDSVPREVYEPGNLEHPAIAGLMLTLEQRLYGFALEYAEEGGTGEIMTETADEKRFRIVWRRPVPMTQTRTGDSFMKINSALFPPKP